jgi:ArsR family metal-binding transcriptional regulator
MAKLEKLVATERRKLMEALAKEKPGTEAYDKIQKNIEKLEDIESKRHDGRIKPIDVFKAVVTIGSTAAVVTADQWIPCVAQKVKLSEFAQKLIR